MCTCVCVCFKERACACMHVYVLVRVYMDVCAPARARACVYLKTFDTQICGMEKCFVCLLKFNTQKETPRKTQTHMGWLDRQTHTQARRLHESLQKSPTFIRKSVLYTSA